MSATTARLPPKIKIIPMDYPDRSIIPSSMRSLQEHATDMPPYFKFLTILAYNVFLYEKVDVAIVEVGIGGEHDCTNIVR